MSSYIRLILIVILILYIALQPVKVEADIFRWGTAGKPVRQADQSYWSKTAALNSDDEVCVAWSDTRDGIRKVYAQKYDPLGNICWDSNGVYVGLVNQVPIPAVTIICSEDDGFIIAWGNCGIDLIGDIRIQKLDINGDRVWGDEGINVSVSSLEARFPKLVSDMANGVIVVWELQTDRYSDIYASRYLADGSLDPNWAPGGTVVSAAERNQGMGLQNTVCSDLSGGVIVIWTDSYQDSLDFVYAQRLSSAGVALWNEDGVLVSDTIGNKIRPNIVSDGNGGAFIAWTDAGDQMVTQLNIFSQHLSTNGTKLWGDNGIAIYDSIGKQEYPAIIEDGYGGFYIAWQDDRIEPFQPDVYAQHVDASGEFYWDQDGIIICGAANGQGNIHLSRMGFEGLVLTWSDDRNGSHPYNDVYAQFIDAFGISQWEIDGIPIGTEEYGQGAPLVLTLNNNNVFFFWEDYRTENPAIYYQLTDDAGNFFLEENGSLVYDSIWNDAVSPQIVRLNDDRYFVVWEDDRFYFSGGSIFFQLIDSSGTPVLQENGVSISEGGIAQSLGSPRVGLSSDSCALTAWNFVRSGTNFNQVYVQKYDDAGNLMWGEDAVRVYPTETNQDRQYICSDGDDGAFVTFSSYITGLIYPHCLIQRVDSEGDIVWNDAVFLSDSTVDIGYASGIIQDGSGNAVVVWQAGFTYNYDIYAAKINGEGDILWEIELCDAGLNQYNPQIINTESGGYVIIWDDYRNGVDFDIYAQQLTTNGAVVWDDNGIPVISMSGDQLSGEMVEDADGNIQIVWQDKRNGPNYDIYMQKINLSGSPLFNPSGLEVCRMSNDQDSPAIVPDFYGGAYISWSDYRDGNGDIYAVHLDVIGQPVNSEWQAQGNIVCDLYHNQIKPFMVSDGFGGSVVIWEDSRSSNYRDEQKNLYIQRMNDYTTSVEDPNSSNSPLFFDLEQNYPNPFNNSTKLDFVLPSAGKTRLTVYDVTGREVFTLLDGYQSAGAHSVVFDAEGLSSGLYFVRLTAGDSRMTRKMVLIK